MKDLGTRIAGRRKALGLTQTAMAERLSVTRQTISRWEAGTVLPDIDRISDIAALLEVSCDYLLKDEVREESAAPAPAAAVGRLLMMAKGRRVKLDFYDDEEDAELLGRPCMVLDFEGNWVRVSAELHRGPVEKLLPLSSILSFEFVEEG